MIMRMGMDRAENDGIVNMEEAERRECKRECKQSRTHAMRLRPAGV